LKGVNLSDSKDGGQIYVNDAQGDAGVAILAKGKDGLFVNDRDGNSTLLSGDSLVMGGSRTPVTLFGGNNGPYLNLTDAQGYQVQLGVSETISKVVGEQHTSSAASLHMFDSKGTVIWSAP
jgi:hypothetical protein